MKKLIALISLILAISCLFTACGSDVPSESPSGNEQNNNEDNAIVTDTPETDAPKTEAPETDAPKTDAPKTDAPSTDAPAIDAPSTDAPATNAPATGAPSTDAPATDAPATNAPATDAPATNAPVINQTKSVVITTNSLGISGAPYGNGGATIDGIGFAFIELGDYGSGIQWRNKNGKQSTLWNTTATPKGITKIEVTMTEDKVGYSNPDAFTIAFGNSTNALNYTTKFSTVKDQVKYTIIPNVNTYTFFKMQIAITYSVYINNITVFYSDAPSVECQHNWKDATCQAPKTCSICNIAEGGFGAHNFVKGVCSVCSEPDKDSDEYKYSVLKGKADRIAVSCAETAVREMLKNPSTMQTLGTEILDSDDYFRYYIKLNYSAANNLGGTITNNAYVLIRVNPVMDGTFYYGYNKILGINSSILEADKAEWGWGTQPDDWSLDAANKYANPTEVSIKLILANPTKYKGQIVKIKEQLVIASNELADLKLYTWQSSGNGQFNYNVDNDIYVFYRMADNAEDLIMLDSNCQKISVVGEVKMYTDSATPFIEAYEITIDKTF